MLRDAGEVIVGAATKFEGKSDIGMEPAPLCIVTTGVAMGTAVGAASDAAKLPGGGRMTSPPMEREELGVGF